VVDVNTTPARLSTARRLARCVPRIGVWVFGLAALSACGSETPPRPAAASTPAVTSTVAFPLRVDAANRRLVGANGEPFFMAGDAGWSLIVQLTREEAVQYLDSRRAAGFTTILVNLVEHQFAAAAPANGYGQQPFLSRGDFSTPNAAYFDHAEWVVGQAAERGLLVLLAPMYLGYQGGSEGWYQELKANGTTKSREYGRYVGQRFAKYPNIVWVNGGDVGPLQGLAEIEALIAGIKEYDSTHIHTAHAAPGRSAVEDYDRPWLDVNTTYSDYRDCDSALTNSRDDHQRPGALPFFHIEGWYEGEGASTSCLLGQMYHPVLLGAGGHVFGNRPMWLFDSGWQGALNSTGTNLMRHFSALFRSREGWGLVPDVDGTIVVSGAGNPSYAWDFAPAARTASNSSVLVYVPANRTVGIDTSKVPGTQFKAWWFNPQTGAAQEIGTFTNGGTRSFTTPAGSPWLLVLDDAAKGLPAPGTAATSGRRPR
jgi:hypothetical protein